MGKRLDKFKDEWAASQEALDAAEARRAKQKAKPEQRDDTVIHNDATIAGNVANSIVHHHGN